MIIAGIREVWYILLCKVVKTRLRPMTIYKKKKRYTDYNSINLYGTYDFSLGNHQFKIMAGFNQESSYQETMEALSYGQAVIEVPSLGSGTSTLKATASIMSFLFAADSSV